MVYLKKLITVLKVNNQVLRETINDHGDIFINIPYGSEYSLHFKNHNDRDCAVKVSIDGNDVLDGNMLIIRAGGTNKLEGCLKNYIVKNKFKFIEKTERIKEYRGDHIDDGLIIIKFDYVKPINSYIVPCRMNYYPPTYTSSNNDNPIMKSCYNASYGAVSRSAEVSDNGITVPGSITSQEFNHGHLGPLENNWETVIFKLLGTKSNGEKIHVSHTIKTKVKCVTCGKNHKSGIRFCSDCGTSLI